MTALRIICSNCAGVVTIQLDGKPHDPRVGELGTLREGGAEITSCSAFVAALLETGIKNPVATKSA